MCSNIKVNVGKCWLRLSLEKETSLPAIFISEIESFNKSENEIKIRGQLSEVIRYFNEIDERHIKDVNCQVMLNPEWIQNMVKLILSGAGLIHKYDAGYWNVNICEEDVKSIFESYPYFPDKSKICRNEPDDINSAFGADRTPLSKSGIYSRFVEHLLGSNCSPQCQLCGFHSIEELKAFIKKLDVLRHAPTIIPFVSIDIDENVWLYIQGHESDKVKQTLSKNGCSCEIITGPNNSKQLKISSMHDNSKVDEAADAIIELHRLYSQKNVIMEDVIIKESNEYELVKKYVVDKKMYGTCSYKICGPKSDLSEFKTKFESADHKKNETKEKSEPVSENDVRVEHVFQSGLKIFISKGNLVRQRTDAIVNPANSELLHGGGAAAAIAKAAGKELQLECKEFIKKERTLPVTKVMHTTAGNLKPNIKYVIHTVGPENKKSKKRKDHLFSMMLDTFVNCFKYANEKLSISSIAVPAISSGIFGVSIRSYGSAMFKAAEVFDKERKNKTLKEIHFVNNDEITVRNICEAFKEWNKGSDADGKSAFRCEDLSINIQKLNINSPHKTNGTSNGHLPQNMVFFENSASNDNERDDNKIFTEEILMALREYAKMTTANIFENSPENPGGKLKNIFGDDKPITSNHSMLISYESAMSGDLSIKSEHKLKKEDYNKNMPGSTELKDSSMKSKDKDEDQCAICLDEVKNSVKLKCGHAFCGGCLEEYNKKCDPKCPTCGMIYGEMKGNQPHGSMDVCTERYTRLPGYENCGTLKIDYCFWDGIQNETHPNPGQSYRGTNRIAYLPDNEEGREVAMMFKRAFENRLLFTIGRSHTTGRNDAIVWNDIHQKTTIYGPYGYPDPGYLKRVKEQLAAKGIYPEDSSMNSKDKDEDQCPICLDEVKNSVKLKCGHAFCGGCLEEHNNKCNPKCPTCGTIYGEMKGNQPHGSMDVCTERYTRLSGYENCGTLRIDYCFRDGIQNETHPNPGQSYRGTNRTAYLPDNEEGREVAKMFKRTFDKGLMFTIGRSLITGRNDVIVWNDIHQKMMIYGQYGYPDPGYLKRVKEQLAAKGIYPEGVVKQSLE